MKWTLQCSNSTTRRSTRLPEEPALGVKRRGSPACAGAKVESSTCLVEARVAGPVANAEDGTVETSQPGEIVSEIVNQNLGKSPPN